MVIFRPWPLAALSEYHDNGGETMNQTAVSGPVKTQPDEYGFVTLSTGSEVTSISLSAYQILGIQPGQRVLLEQLFDQASLVRVQTAIGQMKTRCRGYLHPVPEPGIRSCRNAPVLSL